MGKKVLVIDVETIDVRRLDIYELGYTLLDLETGEMESKGLVLKEVYESDLYPKAYFYKLKKDKYDFYLRDGQFEHEGYVGEFKMVTVQESMNILNKIMKENRGDLAYISAFNMGFDMRAMNFTFNKYIHREGKKQLNYEAFQSRGITPIDTATFFAVVESKYPCYKCYCDKNGLKTGKGNLKTTAEVVYQFIMNNKHFEEEHMGCMDSIIEANIFEYALTRSIRRPELVEEAILLTKKGTKPYLIFKNATSY